MENLFRVDSATFLPLLLFVIESLPPAIHEFFAKNSSALKRSVLQSNQPSATKASLEKLITKFQIDLHVRTELAKIHFYINTRMRFESVFLDFLTESRICIDFFAKELVETKDEILRRIDDNEKFREGVSGSKTLPDVSRITFSDFLAGVSTRFEKFKEEEKERRERNLDFINKFDVYLKDLKKDKSSMASLNLHHYKEFNNYFGSGYEEREKENSILPTKTLDPASVSFENVKENMNKVNKGEEKEIGRGIVLMTKLDSNNEKMVEEINEKLNEEEEKEKRDLDFMNKYYAHLKQMKDKIKDDYSDCPKSIIDFFYQELTEDEKKRLYRSKESLEHPAFAFHELTKKPGAIQKILDFVDASYENFIKEAEINRRIQESLYDFGDRFANPSSDFEGRFAKHLTKEEEMCKRIRESYYDLGDRFGRVNLTYYEYLENKFSKYRAEFDKKLNEEEEKEKEEERKKRDLDFMNEFAVYFENLKKDEPNMAVLNFRDQVNYENLKEELERLRKDEGKRQDRAFFDRIKVYYEKLKEEEEKTKMFMKRINFLLVLGKGEENMGPCGNLLDALNDTKERVKRELDFFEQANDYYEILKEKIKD